MKIALVTDAWAPQTSGVVTTMTRMAEMLGARGHTVEVFHPGTFWTAPCPTYPDIRLALFCGRRLARLLDEFQPDAIHLPTEGPLGLAGARYCQKRRYPYTTTYTTKWPEYIRIRFGIPLRVTYWFLRRFHNGAAHVSVSTNSLEETLRARGFERIVRWGRGVDSNLFRPRDKSAISAPRPVYVYMGRVSVEKNIEAFLSLDLPGTKVVIGDGPALEELQHKYPDVRFLGKKKGEDLAAHLEAGDVFVFPSLTDTFGIVMIEAMACGLPVAAFPVEGPKDVVIQGETGWLDEDLKTAVSKALTMSPQRCREFALQCSWERSVEQFEAMLVPIAPRDGRVS
ncbi:MAG TPA: glycosyltransferase family 1 protein [Candidatus Hydrogenedentes bacterium]|nr:glycosyltransferase family 1 protein [Candidatus Hydrogenedentota bacterium]